MRNTKQDIEFINNQYGKIPPQAVDVEEALLGALINEPDLYIKISAVLKPDSFYKEEHRIIYGFIAELNDKNNPVSLVLLTRMAADKGLLEHIGGAYYLTEISNKAAYGLHIERHARIIQQKYIQRSIIQITSIIQSKAYDESLDVADVLDEAINSFETIDNSSLNQGKTSFMVAKEAIGEISEDCEKVRSGKMTGITTGFMELNRATGGWKAPYYIIIGARPSEGKTTMAWHFALAAAKAGFWVNLYSYEMLATDLFKIAIAGESGVYRTDIRDGYVSQEGWSSINSVLGKLENLSILWYDDPMITATQMRSNTRKNKLNGQCDLVICDYLQLMPAEIKGGSRETQISDISRKLKLITISPTERVPVIALSQLNRALEQRTDRVPQLGDLRESGSLEQDADLVMLLYSNKDDQDTVTNRYIKIAKQKRGKLGTIEYAFNDQMTRLFDLERMNEYPEIKNSHNYNPNQQFEPADENF